MKEHKKRTWLLSSESTCLSAELLDSHFEQCFSQKEKRQRHGTSTFPAKFCNYEFFSSGAKGTEPPTTASGDLLSTAEESWSLKQEITVWQPQLLSTSMIIGRNLSVSCIRTSTRQNQRILTQSGSLPLHCLVHTGAATATEDPATATSLNQICVQTSVCIVYVPEYIEDEEGTKHHQLWQ